MRYKVIILLILLSSFIFTDAHANTMEDKNTAVLRTIDKVSARRKTFEIPVGKTVKFGNGLFIKLRACRKASSLNKPEDAAFLQIWERNKSEEESKWVFSGWMFSSNPSLSAMEHSVYDVWVIECKDTKITDDSEFSDESTPEEEAQ